MDASTRAILNIVKLADLRHEFKSISPYNDHDKSARESFMLKYPEQSMPLVQHGSSMLFGQVDMILLYLRKTVPAVEQHLLNKHTDMDQALKYLDWIKKNAKPYIDEVLQNFAKRDDERWNEEQLKENFKFIEDRVLGSLEAFLKQSKTSYFSETQEFNAIDLIIHSEVC